MKILLEVKNFYSANKNFFFQLFLLLIFYKIIVLFSAFLNYYYTVRVEKFTFSILLDFWNFWDAGYYLSIAKAGYILENSSVAFFPLYPLLIRVFSYLFGFKLAAFLINFFALFGAVVGLFSLVKVDFKEESYAWRAVFYLLLFPSAIFLSAFYTESLFLFFAVWTFYFTRRKNWSKAALFSFFATLTRVEGLVLFVFMLYEYLNEISFDYKKIGKNILFCLAPLVSLALYGAYLQFQFGDFFLFAKAQSFWGKSFTWPWVSLGDYLNTFFQFSIATTPYYLARFFDLAFFILSLGLAVVILLKLRISYALYIILSVIMVSFSGDLASTNRRAIILFPILILLAKWGKRPVINFIILALFAALFNLFIFRFVNHLWAG